MTEEDVTRTLKETESWHRTVHVIRGATFDNKKEVVWIGRWYGEPFNIKHLGTSAYCTKLWKNCDKFFNKKIDIRSSDLSKRGTPRGIIWGTTIKE